MQLNIRTISRILQATTGYFQLIYLYRYMLMYESLLYVQYTNTYYLNVGLRITYVYLYIGIYI